MEENKLKVGRNNTFRFEGHAIVNEKTFTMNSTNQSGTWVYNSLNLGIDCGEKSGINYVNAMGGYNPNGSSKVYLQKIGEDGRMIGGEEGRLVIDWADRLNMDDNDLATINQGNITRAFLETNENGKLVEKKFVTLYDFVEYVHNHIVDKLPITVTGHIEYRPSEDNTWSVSHIVDSISLKTEEYLRPSATVDMMILVGSEAMGQPNVKERNIPFFFNTVTYIRSANNKKYNQACVVPQKVLLDMDSFDINTDAGQRKFKYAVQHWFSPSKEGYVDELQVRCYYTGGVNKTTVSIDDLPENIREAIENGIMDADQVLGGMAINGRGPKDLVFMQVPSFPRKVTDEDGERTIPDYVHTDAKYKVEELTSFEDLVPIEDNSEKTTATAAPVPNINDEEENDGLDALVSMFAKM